MTTASWNGAVLARSDDTIVVEGNHYFPADAVVPGVLKPSAHSSICGWKGKASYYTLDVAGVQNCDAAWYYPDPKPASVGNPRTGRVLEGRYRQALAVVAAPISPVGAASPRA